MPSKRNDAITPDRTANDRSFAESELERSLRPREFAEFTGQPSIIENLRIFIAAARARGEALDHVSLHRPSGLGKTTLAHIIANEMSAQIRTTSGPSRTRRRSGRILTSLKKAMCFLSMKSIGYPPLSKNIYTPRWRITSLTS